MNASRSQPPALTVLAVLLALVSDGCVPPPAELHAASADTVVVRGTFVQSMLLTGELEAVEQVELRVPREAGWRNPIRWMAAEGSFVKEGDIVLEFDNAALVSSLEEAELKLTSAGNDLATKQAEYSANLADQEIENARMESALEKARLEAEVPRDLLPAREYQDRQLNLKKAELDWEKARDSLASFKTGSRADLATSRLAYEKAGREVDSYTRALGTLTLTAPREGLLLHAEHPWEGRKMQVGDTIFAGAPVIQLPDLSSMKVKAALSDVDDGRVLVGMPATCTLDTHPDLRFAGEVKRIDPTAKVQGWQSLRRAFQVSIELTESDPERMIPGMSVQANIETHRAEDVLLAPRQGLDLQSEPPRAFLASGDAVDVELGACNARECIVVQGLSEGARLQAGARG